MNNQQLIQHLYWRAGLGPRPKELAANVCSTKTLGQLLLDAQHVTPIAPADLQMANMGMTPNAPMLDCRLPPGTTRPDPAGGTSDYQP